MQQPIPIIIADAQVLARVGLKHLLEDKRQYDILAEVTNERQLFEVLETHQPQVIIIDYNQPGNFSVESLEFVKEASPGTNILIISSDNEKETIDKVLGFGVNGFLTKTCGVEEIYDAIKATAKGEKFFCTRIVDYLLHKSFSKEDVVESSSPLSQREAEIVKLVAKGMIAKEIADLLHLSPHTVYTHRKNIMKKLNLNSSSELVLYAYNSGLVKE